ncbi:hypothetical protein QBC32DRAFT_338222 [Pseudoneurospora amorphoporcata]|uniref:Uncharacterized protein n=1 Tax=Pseudoneurospora amorphoporcata TaxID=241081 RepID=A0AAN6SHK3_9PEZI|nr:hypothetical protein QBC32DRAFT_338222 [Pseudoneurospora amorphoporcata]
MLFSLPWRVKKRSPLSLGTTVVLQVVIGLELCELLHSQHLLGPFERGGAGKMSEGNGRESWTFSSPELPSR